MGLGRAAEVALLLAPGALIAYLAFNAGGFFPGQTGIVAALLGFVLVVRVTVAHRPFGGISAAAAVAGVSLALFAVWTLVSAEWSGAVGRAVVEHVRVVLYLLVFVLFASLGRSEDSLRWLVRGVVLGAVVVCACAFVTRTLPDVWATPANVSNDRLSYPLTYWNALGCLAVAGFLLCFGLSADARERPEIRVAAAGALPVLAAAALFTFSRGAIALGLVAFALLALLAWTSATPGALLTLPIPGLAVVSTYRADLLATENPTTAAATAQGHDLFLVVALCVLGAGALRALLLLLDRRLASVRLPGPLGRPGSPLAAALVLGVIAAAIALPLGAADGIDRQYDRFVNGDHLAQGEDLRDRLVNPANNGRLEHWRVALEGFHEDSLKGSGAGTYANLWNLHRERVFKVEDAHSLYVEVLGELGIVGLILLAVPLLLILGGLVVRIRGPERVLAASALCAALVWAAQAGVDWMWEMPAVTLWVFAVGGLVLARPTSGAARPEFPRVGRILIGLGILGMLWTPLQLASSEARRLAAAQAFARGDCPTAVDRALAALEALPQRAEPYEILAYCDVRLGHPDLAVRAMASALQRDPDNWELHYGMALARGAARQDPRPAARRAAQLNPREPLAAEAVKRFATKDPRKWRRRALSARLPGRST